MLKTDGSALLIFVHIGRYTHCLVSDKIFLFVLGLIHVEQKFGASVLVIGRDVEVDWTSWQDHHVFSINVPEVDLDGQLGLIELLLAWIRR